MNELIEVRHLMEIIEATDESYEVKWEKLRRLIDVMINR